MQLAGDGIEAVHRLVEHLPKKLRQGGAGVILGTLIAPLRGVGSGQRGQLGHDGRPISGVQDRLPHTAPPPSEPSV